MQMTSENMIWGSENKVYKRKKEKETRKNNSKSIKSIYGFKYMSNLLKSLYGFKSMSNLLKSLYRFKSMSNLLKSSI